MENNDNRLGTNENNGASSPPILQCHGKSGLHIIWNYQEDRKCTYYVILRRFVKVINIIQGVSGGIVNILGSGSMDYSE